MALRYYNTIDSHNYLFRVERYWMILQKIGQIDLFFDYIKNKTDIIL